MLQVNVEAPQLVAQDQYVDTLLYQLAHLRLCLDSLSLQHTAASAVASHTTPPGLAAALNTRQQVRGRDRHPPGPLQLPF